MSLDGVPVQYNQPYDDPDIDFDYEYPIPLTDVVTLRISSPYRGPDVIAEYKEWSITGGKDGIQGLLVLDAVQQYKKDLNLVVFNAFYVWPFLYFAYLWSNWLLLVTSFVFFLWFQGRPLFRLILPFVKSSTPISGLGQA